MLARAMAVLLASTCALGAAPARAQPSVEVRGAMSLDVIRRVLRQRAVGAISRCYGERLSAGDRLEGRLFVRFAIDPRGAVIRAEVDRSELDEEALEACALRAIDATRFPQPRGGGVVIVRWAFSFRPDRPRARRVPRVSTDRQRPTIIYPPPAR